MVIKNEVLNHQKFLRRSISKTKMEMLDLMAMLKRDYSSNILRIGDLETKLTALSDQEIMLELEKFPIYDHLSAEKMSPHFLKLAKPQRWIKGLAKFLFSDWNYVLLLEWSY